MSLTLRYTTESDLFKRPRISTYVKSPARPKLTAEELENALSSLQTILDGLKTDLQRFDEDLGRLKDRSKKLDQEIITEQARLWDYRRRTVEAKSGRKDEPFLSQTQGPAEELDTPNYGTILWRPSQRVEDAEPAGTSRHERRYLRDKKLNSERINQDADEGTIPGGLQVFDRPSRQRREPSTKDAKTELEAYWEELKRRNRSTRPLAH
ncbi:hypothetical protein FRB90_001552 [Tulasnella sp. 427]|nr:hypothetical protein FRB90_001552 [Tulasnella sp. 427]